VEKKFFAEREQGGPGIRESGESACVVMLMRLAGTAGEEGKLCMSMTAWSIVLVHVPI